VLRGGVDFGASITDVALLDGNRILATTSIKTSDYSSAFLKKFVGEHAAGKQIAFACTSGIKRFGFKHVDEIRAIGEGARFLAGDKKFLCANVGTGTPFVLVDGVRVQHVGGTGVGGGTLDGLAWLLLRKRAWEIESLARRGKQSLDLSVREVLGHGIGVVPAEATAANLGKAGGNARTRPEDIARSIINLVAESVGASAAFAARSTGCNKIVFTGRVPALNRLFRERVASTTALFGAKSVFPEHGEAATAIGAALLA
jgi:type II pantothenate kinase